MTYDYIKLNAYYCMLFCRTVRVGIRFSVWLVSGSAHIYRVAQKSKPLPIFQKIVLKIANKIRFFR